MNRGPENSDRENFAHWKANETVDIAPLQGEFHDAQKIEYERIKNATAQMEIVLQSIKNMAIPQRAREDQLTIDNFENAQQIKTYMDSLDHEIRQSASVIAILLKAP